MRPAGYSAQAVDSNWQRPGAWAGQRFGKSRCRVRVGMDGEDSHPPPHGKGGSRAAAAPFPSGASAGRRALARAGALMRGPWSWAVLAGILVAVSVLTTLMLPREHGPAAAVRRWAGFGGSCGDGRVEGREECDDANNRADDACLPSCQVARCGDGVVRRQVEDCDDGNRLEGDGCTGACLRCPPGRTASPSPATAIATGARTSFWASSARPIAAPARTDTWSPSATTASGGR